MFNHFYPFQSPEGEEGAGGSLLDHAESSESEAAEPGWYWSDEVPGAGDRPDWLKEHHKTVEVQAKNYVELEKKLGAFTGAPEEYVTDNWVPEDLKEAVQLDLEDPVLKEFVPMFKGLGVSQPAMDQIVQKFVQIQHQAEQEAADQFKRSLESLGSNGTKRIQAVDTYLKSALPDDLYQGLRGTLVSAEAFQAVEQLVGKARQAKLPDTTNDTPAVTKHEVEAMWHKTNDKGQRLVDVDPEYRARVRDLRRRLVGDHPHLDVVG